MNHHFIEGKLEKVAFILEMTITALIAVGVIMGIIDLIKIMYEFYFVSTKEAYEVFHEFLEYALVLIVGIELMLMMLTHSTKVILELILFVIARKMLIYSHGMLDLVLGSLAILLIFVALKYLTQTHIPSDSLKKKLNKNAADEA